MKVKELIKKLSKLHPESDVWINHLRDLGEGHTHRTETKLEKIKKVRDTEVHGCQNPFFPGHHIMWEDSGFCFFCSKKMKVAKIKVKG